MKGWGLYPDSLPDVMTAPMRVLTLRPPWGEAVTRGDDQTGKRTENRRERTHYRGLVAIHSGRTPDWDAPPRAWQAARLRTPWELGITQKTWVELYATGMVISVAELTGCHYHLACPGEGTCSPWAISNPGTWHWELANVRPLPVPVPWTGRLGLLPIGGDAGNMVRAQLAHLP
jgi:hypothetical protein